MASENYRGEGKSIYLDLVASPSGSDICAGDMVVLLASRATAGNTGLIAPLTGLTSCQYFIGVADSFLSGGQRGLTVLTEGVFEFQLASAVDMTGHIGDPVFGVSKKEVSVCMSAANGTGMISIGNIIGKTLNTALSEISECSSKAVLVRINPPMLKNWTTDVTTAMATAEYPGIFLNAAAGGVWNGN